MSYETELTNTENNSLPNTSFSIDQTTCSPSDNYSFLTLETQETNDMMRTQPPVVENPIGDAFLFLVLLSTSYVISLMYKKKIKRMMNK